MRRRWSLFSHYFIPDLIDPAKLYLHRLRLLQTPWGGVYLHYIHLPDADRHMHDHPWDFSTFILRGGYSEITPDGIRRWHRGSFHRMRAEERHSILALYETPTVTLVFVGPRRREWGFHTDSGWVHNEIYESRVRAGLV